MKNLLLITGCVNIKCKKTELRDSKIRLDQYIETIRWAIEESNFDCIVFCENSNCQFDFIEYVNKINTNNKIFEYITFSGSEETSIYGGTYGEMEIIKYAYYHSKYFSKADCFWKLTGRLKIKNCNDILKKATNRDFIFINYYKWFDTRFYKMPVKVFKENYLDLNIKKIIEEENIQSLEIIYYNVFNNKKIIKAYKNTNFPIYPIYVGMSGSFCGEYKTTKIQFFINNTLCKLNIFNNQTMQKLYIMLNPRGKK